MRPYLLLSLGLATLCGCAEETGKKAAPVTSIKNPATVSAKPDSADPKAPPAADNSAVNERDRAGVSKTPIDQNENTADIKITADIRKRVVAQDGFSISAQNVKIITADGKVTLRGPVTTEKERDIIKSIAEDVAGKDHVDNQLEVAP